MTLHRFCVPIPLDSTKEDSSREHSSREYHSEYSSEENPPTSYGEDSGKYENIENTGKRHQKIGKSGTSDKTGSIDNPKISADSPSVSVSRSRDPVPCILEDERYLLDYDN